MSELEFNTADAFTTGAVGEPGSRVFMLQASKGSFVQTWILEKEQVIAMARGGYELLSQIGEHEMTRELLGRGMIGASSPEFIDAMTLKEDDPAFRIDGTTITMMYDKERNLIEVAFSELSEPEFVSPATVKILVTSRQLASFGIQGMKIVAQGRPICPLCGHPMGDEGHHCPASNGHNPRAGRGREE